uniref:Lipocalin/cytosolic fatty-acid binding domain-containing protein n=1 Tax=Photinus pyralis TaxID=7054 RepID=A0A1Y1LIV7_PHOPY
MALTYKSPISLGIFLVLVHTCAPSGFGKCPRHDYIQNFSLERFAGHWYEIERTFYLMELTVSCTTLDLIDNNKGQLEVTVTTLSRWSGNLRVSEGIASSSRKDPSLFLYRVNTILPQTLAKYLPGAGFYQVLDTDYDRFAILWSCSNFGVIYTDLVWIFARGKEIDAELRAKIYGFLKTKGIDSERLVLPKNNNCTDEY